MNREWRDDRDQHEPVLLPVPVQQDQGSLPATALATTKLSGEALGGLLEEFRPYLLTIAWQQFPASLGAKLGRSDIVQEALMKGFLKFDDFSGKTREELRAWLRKILENLIKSRIRDFRTKSKNIGLEETLSGQEAVRKPVSPSQALLGREEREQLDAALSRLPEREREALLLRYQDGLTYQKIGERLGLSERGAERVWFRAVKALAREMGVKSTVFEK
jgi:RNA polymerase sigma-70 factor (ECF subfamily)